jgi:acyl-CoA thioester hydrolase
MSEISGQFTNSKHRLCVRVYYEDTDFSGYVYHSNYLKFCERARSDMMRLLGVDQNSMFVGDNRMFIVIRRMVCEFLTPARFDDVLTVESTPTLAKGARMEMSQRVLRGDTVLFTAEVLAVILDANGRPKRAPADLAEKLQAATKPVP